MKEIVENCRSGEHVFCLEEGSKKGWQGPWALELENEFYIFAIEQPVAGPDLAGKAANTATAAVAASGFFSCLIQLKDQAPSW